MAALLYRVAFRMPSAAAATLGCLLAFAPAVSAGAQDSAADCTVARLRGTATVLRDGSSSRLVPGAALRGDDQLVTGAKARLRITCRGGIELTIGPHSRGRTEERRD